MKRFLKRIIDSNFNTINYWENRYENGGNSGNGSYNKNARFKADILNSIINQYGIKEIVEFGCGDGNNLQQYKVDRYIGLDISRSAIRKCIERYKDDGSKYFMFYDPFHFTSGAFLADLTLSFEVIFHLVEEDMYNKYINDLFNCSKQYVLILASNHESNHQKLCHVKHRIFLKDVPNNFELISTIDKTQFPAGIDMFSSFYLFKKKNFIL